MASDTDFFKGKKGLSHLVEDTLQGLSPIQTIMKMAEPSNIKEMGVNPDTMISFGGGWCNHFAPEPLRKIYIDLCKDKQSFHDSGRYSAIIGNGSCRRQLAKLERNIYGMNHISEKNIALGQSSTQLFHDVLRVIANPGDDICVLDPTYANYANAVKIALPSSTLRFISALDASSWEYLKNPQRSLEELQEFAEQGAKALVVPVPDNPTSQIPPDSFLKGAADIMQDHQGFLILDFAYKSLWFDKKPSCFHWSPEDMPHVIGIHSHSKWLSSLGRRLGWIEASQSVINGLEKINESMLLSPDTLHSMAIAQFLETSLENGFTHEYVKNIRQLYKKTATVLTAAIETHLDWPYLEPMGGLYTVCPTPNKVDPVSFVKDLLKQTRTLIIPGVGFGPSMNHGVRLSYGPLVYDHDLIVEGIKRISSY
ncbi:MAG TPA: pyridoxal phosphate-dependent aminotransferase [Candidatus Thermoplasmatota archaeon]|nr:pyridoxal phosphate-dependent aminotransferase [Candidatus Thermoplasmatota archaeon]